MNYWSLAHIHIYGDLQKQDLEYAIPAWSGSKSSTTLGPNPCLAFYCALAIRAEETQNIRMSLRGVVQGGR